MAQFRGTVEGNRGQASRLGHKTYGLTTTCNAWDIGIDCEAYHSNGEDIIVVYLTGGSNARHGRKRLAWVDSSGKIHVSHELDNVSEEQGAA